jgi:osomolarity two-component system, sensor histidine kinase SLN1
MDATVLATQNMAATSVVQKSQEIEFKALEGSLGMMSKGKPRALEPAYRSDTQLSTE